MAVLLIIEDEAVLAKNMARYFVLQGHSVEAVDNGVAGVEAARRLQPDVVIVDFQLPGMDGLEVIRALRQIDGGTRIIMVTGHASVPMAVDAMKAGTMDLLTKPIVLAHLKTVVDRALVERGAQRELDYLHRRQADASSLDALVGDSPAMRQLRELVRTIALREPADGSSVPPVLVTGETGTGKELIARACHFAGPRAGAPFIEINCAALPAHLIEGELFGHEKGAFTDAQSRKIGLIEAADGGTLFLDEIGELDLSLQAKLLRVLENQRIRRLGAVQDHRVNVRFVAATNRDLEGLVEAGRFRADLLYRLRVFQIQSPPLRDRGADVIELAHRFIDECARRYARPAPRLGVEALEALQAHRWLGNVRELRNLVERAVLLAAGPELDAAALGLPTTRASPHPASASPAPSSLDQMERQALRHALSQTDWNVTRAARLLGISRDTLRYRIDKHGLNREDGASSPSTPESP